ncbi:MULTISPECIES: hypothetical protein [Saliphagus]|uniref:Uncharacterized protein n=1 Tax=Saliphagus infecundisoli TaxID=1849069 RepID=A0ABD5QFS9_9EURY|nr:MULTISPECIES: hypothetical protein [Saliphagus]
MTTIRSALLVLAVLSVVVASAGSIAVADGDDGTDEPAGAERPMGTELSTFLQSSTADAGAAVTTGMFLAGYENGDADRREAAVAERTAELEAKLSTLRDEHDRLSDRTNASSIADRPEAASLAYTAQLTRLEAEIETLERAIDELAPRADEVGIESESVAELRTGAAELAESNRTDAGIATGTS